MAKNDHSARFALVKSYCDRGLWSAQRVAKAVECGWITSAERDEVTGGAIDPASVLASLGSRPTKAELLDAADALGVEVPEGATNPEIAALLEAGAE